MPVLRVAHLPRYLVYVEGHCAACRYGFMMRLGSVIIKVRVTYKPYGLLTKQIGFSWGLGREGM